MDAREWVVVDGRGLPVEGLRLLSDPSLPARQAPRTDARGVAPLPPGSTPAAAFDPLGVREVPFRVEGTRVVVDRRQALGWAVDIPLDGGNDVELLVDSRMFPPMLDAVDRARRTVHLSQLLLFKDFRCGFERPPGLGRSLLDHLRDAAARGARVRILLNENVFVPDTVRDVMALCEEDACMEVRPFPMTPNVLHAKVLVVDGEEAFVVGPPFEQRYWDTSSHRDVDPRRGDPRPLHDVSLRVRGPAVGRIDAFFCGLWSLRGEPAEPCPPPPPQGRQVLQVVPTLPIGLLPGEWHPRGAREGYRRALANARDFVYLETQYFTSPSITEAIAAALEDAPGLQVILVLNTTVDVPGYVAWQKRRLAQLGHPDHPRLGVFTLWTPTPDPAAPRGIYVHSKLAFADDAWASVGTSNLDSLSLEKGREWGFELEANVDLNAVLLDGVDGAPATGLVGSMRRRVWAEHLGDEGVWTARRPEGGWLAVWRRVAQANALALEEGRFPARGRVLPYVPGPSPMAATREPPVAGGKAG